MKLFKYLYYRIYEWDLNTWGSGHRPQLRALFGVCSVMGVNILTIILILQFLGLTNLINNKNFELGSVFLGLLLWGIMSSWLVNNGKYEQIVMEYKNEPESKRHRNTIILWLYVILTFTMPWIIGILHSKFMG